jgi:hypothetical protein
MIGAVAGALLLMGLGVILAAFVLPGLSTPPADSLFGVAIGGALVGMAAGGAIAALLRALGDT